jgi:hypothetical protein
MERVAATHEQRLGAIQHFERPFFGLQMQQLDPSGERACAAVAW